MWLTKKFHRRKPCKMHKTISRSTKETGPPGAAPAEQSHDQLLEAEQLTVG